MSVVNKIAAGEIIIQPANALKELLENSIDAGSTTIDILVKDGGMKLLQITDNGRGVNREDLKLLCERFATSKLSKFEDLESIATYGFRGEALASISHISRLSVITKTKDSPLAYKAFYLDGKLVTPGFKIDEEKNTAPKPIAGKDGTQLIVEDLFYNVPSRLKALRSKNDEFAKIVDVIGRYAVHTGSVGFNCKKFGDSHQVVSTRPNLPLKERIRTVFGTAVASELIEFEIDGQEVVDEKSPAEQFGLLKVSGAITSSNYINKKRVLPVFFINHRLVSCDPLKRSLQSVYHFFLPKGNQPFMYLSLEIDPKNLDVNVHPTKREVRFLHEEEIVEVVSGKVQALLSNVDSSRKFKTQGVLFQSDKRPWDESISLQATKKYRQENKLVRVDAQQTKLTSFIASKPAQNQIADSREKDQQHTDRARVDVTLDSVAELKQEITDSLHRPLTNIFTNSVYVGIVDEERRLCCFQYDVKLFLCDYAAVLYEFYYQVALAEFCNYGEYVMSQPLTQILDPIYKHGSGVLKPKEEVMEALMSMKEMFQEYFRISFTEAADGTIMVESLPMIMKDVNPSTKKLPYFFYRLGNSISDSEKACLQGIMRQLALLYVPDAISPEERGEAERGEAERGEGILQEERESGILQDERGHSDSMSTEEGRSSTEKSGDRGEGPLSQAGVCARDQLNSVLENVVFPQLKRRFIATKELAGDVIQIADLPGLYRVFERC